MPSDDPDQLLLLGLRRLALDFVALLEKRLGIQPTTAELRRVGTATLKQIARQADHS